MQERGEIESTDFAVFVDKGIDMDVVKWESDYSFTERLPTPSLDVRISQRLRRFHRH
jgi:hypothetical protein